MINELWKYRAFIFSSIQNDLKNRLARSKLGFIWLVVQPLMLALIFTLILSQLMQAKFEGVDSIYGYPIYLLAGILCWTVFAETIQRCLNMFIDNKTLIHKVAIPKVLIPTIVAGQVYVQGLIMFLVICGVVLAVGHPISLSWLWFPVIIGLTVLLAVSIGLILGTMNVFLRDIGQLTPVLLQFGFWLTPIVYTVVILPEKYQYYLGFNPMVYLVDIYQMLFLYGKAPNGEQLLGLVALIFVLSALSYFMFKRASQEMVDEL